MLFDASVTLTLCVEFLSSWRVGNCCEASLHFHAELWCANCTFDASIFFRITTNYSVKRSQSRRTLEWVDMSGSVKKATLRFRIKFLAFSLKAVHFIKSVSRNNDCWVILWDAFEYVYLNDLCVQHIHIINIDWQVNWTLDLTLFDIWCVGDSFGGFCLFFSHWIKFIATLWSEILQYSRSNLRSLFSSSLSSELSKLFIVGFHSSSIQHLKIWLWQ